ncbi:MAG TPA: drug/metabolite exporter YedA [Myxococcales bacterium]|nr:drug/metabolite exporter YedA [Myxococcales bacterium]
MKTDRSRILLALGALYLIWGSTFLGIRVALEGYPPLLLAGLRFIIAGSATYAWARWRGAPPPTWAQWRSSAVVGTLLVCANACVVIAEQWVSSGVAAVAIASVPLWVALFAGLFGRWPSGGEWLGLAIGLAGVALLQTGGDLRASPAGALVLTVSCASWALGSIWSRRLPLPAGLLGSGAQMLAGGTLLFGFALLHGERLPAALPPARATLALGYLIVAGSMVGYSAYQFLLSRVRPTLAASYAYVNPVVAVGLGAAIAGETVAPRAVGALALILGGMAMLALRRQAA